MQTAGDFAPTSPSSHSASSSSHFAQPPAAQSSKPIATARPAHAARIRVIKRNGESCAYDANKIGLAISKAYLAVEGSSAEQSSRIHERVAMLVAEIDASFARRVANREDDSPAPLHIEDIQDQVELALMRAGDHKVARAYVLYREQRTRARQEDQAADAPPPIALRLQDGREQILDQAWIEQQIAQACAGLKDVDPVLLRDSAMKNIYRGMSLTDVASALVMSARTLIERDPDYSYAAARLLRNQLLAESCALLGVDIPLTPQEGALAPDRLETTYRNLFTQYLRKGVELELLSPKLLEFELDQLGAALDLEADRRFSYLGLQTLYDRYFLHWEQRRFELPQWFFMRVAMGLAQQEDRPTERAIEFYRLLSSFDYMCSTPTLFNSGTLRPQLSSCYLTTVPDQLDGIYEAVKSNALLSKWAGGLGNDWTPVRAMGSHIKGTNGRSQGVIPFLKVVNDTAVAVNQGGKRKGAVCAYLESWHLDIEDFLELRKNTGDERRRTHDMNSANWIPDLFMKRLLADQEWTLFSPADAPDLHDLYGAAFEKRYQHYEQLHAEGTLKLAKKVKAKALWQKMLAMLFETGHAWITFKDPCNLRSPQQHVGVVHSSNLCTEITLNTSAEEIAVCNLGSINLAQHIHDGQLDTAHLERTIRTAVRMLDNVIDINFYPLPQAAQSNLKHRPIGLGLMGFQDALHQLRLPYGSSEAVVFADYAMESISYFAIQASAELARERGRYGSYAGSLWDQGIFPIDSLALLEAARGEAYLALDRSSRLDWSGLRALVREQGLRNSNIMAIAPTATISNIVGVSQSIEPTYQNLFVKSNLSGEFLVVNPALVADLKALGLWDEVMVNDLKYYDGSIQAIERIPAELKALYATAFEIDPRWLVEAASVRQKWIDQAQSLNLYLAEPSGKKLDSLYKLAWARGLKTTYYLRSLGATHMEKSVAERETVSNEIQERAAAEPAAKFCSILDPECEACQ